MDTFMNIQQKQSKELPGVLGRYIDKLHYLEDLSSDAGKKFLPQPGCNIIINLTNQPVTHYKLDGYQMLDHPAFCKILHIQTTPVVCGEIDVGAAIGVHLKPYTLPALGIAPDSNTMIDVSETLTGIAQLRRQLMTAPSDKRVTMVEQFLENAIRPLPEKDLQCLETVCTLFSNGETDLDEAARQLGMTKRTLYMLVKKYTGVTPKTLSQLYLLSRFVALINHSPRPIRWPEVVSELGLYDQSHLIKVFKKITGMTPTKWFSAIEFTGLPADEWVYPTSGK